MAATGIGVESKRSITPPTAKAVVPSPRFSSTCHTWNASSDNGVDEATCGTS